MKVHQLLQLPNHGNLSYPKSDLLVDNETFTGIEIELENAPDIQKSDKHQFWVVTSDGSLRPRDTGREIVFSARAFGNMYSYRLPLCGLNLEKALREFCEYIEDIPHTFSERTGLHIHLDVMPLDLFHVRRIIIMYVILEYVLFRYCGLGRMGSAYCRPFAESAQFHVMEDWDEQGLKGSVKKEFFMNFCKRSALNVGSVVSKGTIEFRLHPATDKFDELITWINIIHCLKRYAKDELDFTNLFKNVSEYSAEDFLSTIFGPEIASCLTTPFTKQDLIRGIRNAQQILVPGLQDSIDEEPSISKVTF